jgi:hypothetical protein
MRLTCSLLLAATASAGLAALASVANAAEYCVSCAGPEAVYRCEIEGTPEGQGTDPKAQLLCITELAKSGGHESCAVTRGSSVPCAGETRLLAAPIGEPVPVPSVGADAPVAIPPEPAPEDAAGEGKPPRTVEEMAKNTVRSSKEGLEKAGETVVGGAKTAGEKIGSAGSAVGSAAKKTWDCLVSLFNDC